LAISHQHHKLKNLNKNLRISYYITTKMQHCCDLNKSLQNHLNELNTWKWNPIQKRLREEVIALGNIN
jgi:hypothetical protein